MSAPVDRITAVLRQHYLVDNWGCACSASVRGTTGWAAHVAEQVAAALQLTEETERISLLDIPCSRHRWVSAWSEKS